MAVSQQQLYIDLEALTEDQIEVGLDAGVWAIRRARWCSVIWTR